MVSTSHNKWLGHFMASPLLLTASLLAVVHAACWDDPGASCIQEPEPSRGSALLQTQGSQSEILQKKHHHKGAGALLLQKMESYIASKGQLGLSPTEQLEVQEIREILNMDLLPSLLQAAAVAQAEIDALYKDVLDCQIQVVTGLDINLQLWNQMIAKQKNVTDCMTEEVLVIEDEIEKCKEYERIKKEIHLPTIPPPDRQDNLEAYKYLQAMSDYFCGIEKTFIETYEKCRMVKQNYTKLVETCKTIQVDYEIAICGWKSELVETCSEYSDCWEQSVQRFNERVAGLTQLEEDHKAEMLAVKRLDCLWETWNFSSDPCIVNVTMVKICEEVPINLTNVTLVIPELPEPRRCGPPNTFRDVALPCTEEFLNAAYGYLGFPAEDLDRIKGDCRECQLLTNDIPSSSSSTEPVSGLGGGGGGGGGGGAGGATTKSSTTTPKVVSDVKSEGGTGDDITIDLPTSKTTSSKASSTSKKPVTEPAVVTIPTPKTSTEPGEVSIQPVSTPKTSTKPGEVSIQPVSTPKTSTKPAVVSIATEPATSKTTTSKVVTLPPNQGSTTAKPTTTVSEICYELYTVVLSSRIYDPVSGTTRFEYDVKCIYGAEDMDHWDLVEVSNEHLGGLEEMFIPDLSTDAKWEFDEDKGVLAIKSTGSMRCKTAPSLLEGESQVHNEEKFALTFAGELPACDGEYRIQPVGDGPLVGEGCPCEVPCLPDIAWAVPVVTTTTTTTEEPEPETTTTTTLCPTACQAPVCADGDQDKGGWLLDEGMCTVFSSAPGPDGIRRCGLGEEFEGEGSVYCHLCIKQEAQCILWGDPHIKPFDHQGSRTNVHMYPYGDYWMVKSEKVLVEARYWSTRRDGNSQIRGLAVSGEFLQDNVLYIFPQDGKMLWNDKEIFTEYPSKIAIAGLLYGEYHDEVKAARPRGGRQGIPGLDLLLPMGVRLTINRHRAHLDVLITVRKMDGGCDGHCGNFNDEIGDDTTRTITERMGDRVPPSENLFKVKDYSYIGCFDKTSSKTDFPLRIGSSMNDEQCAMACVEYSWFGLQGSKECWCGNTYDQYDTTDGCNCEGNVGTDKRCIYGYFDSVQPPVQTLDDCAAEKMEKAVSICEGAMLKDGLSEEQKDEFLQICKMDICFGEEGFADADAWTMHMQLPCASLADVQRVCKKSVGPCGGGVGEIPGNCKFSDCDEFNGLGWYRNQVRLLADGQARGDKTATSIVQADHRPGVCVTPFDTLEICGSDSCSRTDMRFRRSDMAPMNFVSKEHGCLYDEAAVVSNFFIMSFKMRPVEVSGKYTLRASSGYRTGRVRLMLYHGRIRLEIRDGNPSYQEFAYTFSPNTDYDVTVVYDGPGRNTKMFLSGKLEEAKTYAKAPPNPMIHDGYIGCYDRNMKGHFQEKFAGTISDFYLQVKSTTETTTPPFPPLSFDSTKQKCYRENRFLETDYAKITFKMKPSDLGGWQAIRNGDRWVEGSLHLQLRDKRLEMGVKGSNPAGQWFKTTIQSNVEYDVEMVYDKDLGSVTLTLDGKLVETRYFKKAARLRMIPGYFGCWDSAGSRRLQRFFKGTITDFMIDTTSPRPKRPLPPSFSTVMDGPYCSGDDCKSKVHCPLGMAVVACDTTPYNYGDGAYVDTESGECTARGMWNGKPVRARATCLAIETSSVKTEGYEPGEKSLSCPAGKAISCNCYSPWTLKDNCGGVTTFAPTDGVCKRKVGKAALFAICSETPVAVVEGDQCTGDDCVSEAPCPEGMSPVTCQPIPWDSVDGAYVSLKTGICTARGAWGAPFAKGRATCLESSKYMTHSVVAPSSGWSELGSLSVGCVEGSPISCSCYTAWKVNDNCGGKAIFDPTGGVCAATVGKARIYAICPGPLVTTTTTTQSIDITLPFMVEGEPCMEDDCFSRVACPNGMSVVKCETNPPNSRDGAYLDEKTGECVARGSWASGNVAASATCLGGVKTTAEKTPGWVNADASLSCSTGEAISCNCYSPWKVQNNCGNIATFEPTDGICKKKGVGRASIHAICSTTKVAI